MAAPALLLIGFVLIVAAGLSHREAVRLRAWGAGEQAFDADSLTLRFLALGLICLALGFAFEVAP